MMLTREQAAATWCPMTLVARMPNNPPGCSCIADKCAMWRWGDTKPETKEQVVEVRVAHVGGVVTNEKRIERVLVDMPYRGYCGLANWPRIAGGAD